nr:MtrAB system histidine kinase MtrB [Motilibacter deserti]
MRLPRFLNRVLPARPWRRVVAAWRRGLRMRVVTTTVVLSLLVVALLGTFLFAQVRDGVLGAKVDSALAETRSGYQFAQATVEQTQEWTPGLVNSRASTIVGRLASGGGEAGRREVLLLPGPHEDSDPPGDVYSSYASGVNTPQSIPPTLRREVQGQQEGQGRTYWAYAMADDRDGTRVPALIVGAALEVGAKPYELYYVFPLDQEAQTLGLVRRTLAVAGLALVVLVGLIAYVVARTVVTPVRMAARIAERLAAGRLEERMHIRGEDDLARLAASFNRMARSLQSQIRRLEDLSRLQRRFVSDVSHELRTPLTTVRMAADVLHSYVSSFPPDVARSSELLQAQLDRFEDLLADLLEISRFDAGAAVLDPEPCDLRAIARRVLDATEPLAERRGSTLELVAPEQACTADVDGRRIERIVRNLVVNAIEHGEGKPVVVTVAADDEAVALSVQDSGVGLSPEEAGRVFDRFWRADPSRARQTGGTGLGLSIALEDAHLHGGELEAYGEPGRGAQFRLTLPRRAGQELGGSPIPLGPDRPRFLAVGAPYQRTEVARG